ncbi:MAG: hypothetical protein ACREJ3_11200 [Polyangiaceae bacterium]
MPSEDLPTRPRARDVLRRVARPGIAVASVVLATARTAPAAPQDARLAAARELFASAERDEDNQMWSRALAKLRDVASVKLTAGVRYHVALCEEHLGQIAAALDDFTDAEALARTEDASDVLQLVGAKVANLTSRVPRLVIHVVPDLPGAIVTLDGDPVPPVRIGTVIPLDPGNHRLETNCPGRVRTVTIVTLNERDSTTMDVPLGAFAVPTPPATKAPGAARTAPTSDAGGVRWPAALRFAEIATTSGAAVLSGVGIGAYLAAGTAHEDSVRICAGVVSTDPSACDAQKNLVRRWDWFAAFAWVGALTSATVAVVLWSKGESHPYPSARIVVAPGAVGVAGRF